MVNVHFYCYVNLINLPITMCLLYNDKLTFDYTLYGYIRSVQMLANQSVSL